MDINFFYKFLLRYKILVENLEFWGFKICNYVCLVVLMMLFKICDWLYYFC